MIYNKCSSSYVIVFNSSLGKKVKANHLSINLSVGWWTSSVVYFCLRSGCLAMIFSQKSSLLKSLRTLAIFTTHWSENPSATQTVFHVRVKGLLNILKETLSSSKSRELINSIVSNLLPCSLISQASSHPIILKISSNSEYIPVSWSKVLSNIGVCVNSLVFTTFSISTCGLSGNRIWLRLVNSYLSSRWEEDDGVWCSEGDGRSMFIVEPAREGAWDDERLQVLWNESVLLMLLSAPLTLQFILSSEHEEHEEQNKNNKNSKNSETKEREEGVSTWCTWSFFSLFFSSLIKSGSWRLKFWNLQPGKAEVLWFGNEWDR